MSLEPSKVYIDLTLDFQTNVGAQGRENHGHHGCMQLAQMAEKSCDVTILSFIPCAPQHKVKNLELPLGGVG